MNSVGIEWALTGLQNKQPHYRLLNEYYEGLYCSPLSEGKYLSTLGRGYVQVRENLAAVVVDTIADRIQISNFTLVGDENPTIEAQIGEITRREKLNELAGQVHTHALSMGDAYVVVDKRPDGKAVFYANDARLIAVKYDAENPGRITQAAKWWVDTDERGEARIYLNLYYLDRIEKYVTQSSFADTALPSTISSQAFQPIPGDWRIPNSFGRIPVFHFRNNAAIGRYGKSEIDNVRSQIDALNKFHMGLMVAEEFAAFPQRVVTGVQFEVDDEGKPITNFKAGANRLWHMAEENAKVFQLAAADLSQYTNIIDSKVAAISRLSGIPPYYLLLGSGGWPSGESLKVAEARLTAKVRDRQVSFGNVWASVMRFAIEIEGVPGIELDTVWEDTTPRNEATEIQNIMNKVALGLPQAQALKELGYTSKEIEAFKKMRDEEDADKQKAFNAGLGQSLETLYPGDNNKP